MFQRLSFPSEALGDVSALLSLSTEQLGKLAKLLDSKEATPPIDPPFIGRIQKALGVPEEQAEGVVRLCVVLQRLDFNDEAVEEVVDDFKELIRRESPPDCASLLAMADEKRQSLCEIVKRKPMVTRTLRVRRIAEGTQPIIESIRTLIHLRPLFTRDEEQNPIDIECLVPAMTLEIKFEKDDQAHSATFSVSEAKLVELIKSLEDTREKLNMVNQRYSTQICI